MKCEVSYRQASWSILENNVPILAAYILKDSWNTHVEGIRCWFSDNSFQISFLITGISLILFSPCWQRRCGTGERKVCRGWWVECPITEWSRRLYLACLIRVEERLYLYFRPKFFSRKVFCPCLLIWRYLFTLWFWEFKVGNQIRKLKFGHWCSLPTW